MNSPIRRSPGPSDPSSLTEIVRFRLGEPRSRRAGDVPRPSPRLNAPSCRIGEGRSSASADGPCTYGPRYCEKRANALCANRRAGPSALSTGLQRAVRRVRLSIPSETPPSSDCLPAAVSGSLPRLPSWRQSRHRAMRGDAGDARVIAALRSRHCVSAPDADSTTPRPRLPMRAPDRRSQLGHGP
jgi:hypothetical protein